MDHLNEKDFEKDFTSKRKIEKKINKKIIACAGCGAAVLLAALGIFFIKSNSGSGTAIDGYVSEDGENPSGTITELFYKKGKHYLSDIKAMDSVITADVIATDDGYAIRTEDAQITVVKDQDYYYINNNKISDDSDYIKPVLIRGKLYCDTDTIFNSLSYDTEYNLNSDHTLIELSLTKSEGNNYSEINTKDTEIETIAPTEPQIEEGSINKTQDINKPKNDNELQTVPQPTAEYTPETEPETIASTEDIPVSEVERPTEMPNRKSEEKFNQIWKTDETNISNVFKGGVPSYGNKVYKKRTDDFIAYNPMAGGIYYDTISILHNPTSNQNEFILATFSADWSDQAMNTPMDQDKKYYENIPRIYEATIKQLLGENEGTNLYNWIKEHADKTTTGGYIAKIDKDGKVYTEWTDGEVGDGVMASKMNFEDWQYKETDDGLRYNVCRDGDGFIIRIYKN